MVRTSFVGGASFAGSAAGPKSQQSSSARVASVGLIIKEANKDAYMLAERMAAFLRARGIACVQAVHGPESSSCRSLPDVDCVLTLGGDGTFAAVARCLMGRNIPLAGVNFGRVGFLATISPGSWQDDLAVLAEEGMRVESRMALHFEHVREGTVLRSGAAVNDVVMTRGLYARIINLDIAVDGTPLTSLRADGLILAAPTGATGYSRSSGGPLLFPSLSVYAVTAISSYLGQFPPLVLEAGSCCEVTAGRKGTDIYLTVDGQENHALEAGDVVRVHGLPDAFFVAEFGKQNYFEKLKHVGYIQSSHNRGE